MVNRRRSASRPGADHRVRLRGKHTGSERHDVGIASRELTSREDRAVSPSSVKLGGYKMTLRATASGARGAGALSHAASRFAARRNRGGAVPSVLFALGAMLVAAAMPTVAAANTTGLSNGIVQRA